MTAVILLPERLDISSCQSLLPQLLETRSQPVELDGSEVRQIGAVGAELLLSARQSWLSDGVPFAVTGLTEQASECLTDMGVDLETTEPAPTGETA